MDRGKVKVRDYKVIGPVGTILLEGSTDIVDETLDLQAVIVPNLDVSGRVSRTPDELWSMNLRSEQTSGTLKWQERDGRVLGRMSARFARLSLGDDPHDAGSLLPQAEPDETASFDDDLEIPGIVLQADELRLFGHSMGALSLEGVRDGARHVWTLNNLRLGDGDARLRGSGSWRLRGPDRGLELNASVQAGDLGAWMNRAGWKDVLAGGEGTLKGRFQ